MDMDTLVTITDTIDTYMYTYFLMFLLIGAGIYFTIRTKGVQFTHLKDMFRAITEKKHVEGGKSVSSFQAMMVSTASRVGTGNIAGVATAIAVGGPGAVFWMWIMALINGASAFVESTLAQIWKVRGENGEFRGGPAYYIEQALHKRWLGILFAISLILCFALGFNGLQTYNMSSSIEYFYNEAVAGQAGAPAYFDTQIPFAIGLLLAIVFAFVLFGGTHRISFLTSFIVPAMAVLYLLLAVVMAVMNAGALPTVFGLIFSEAFDFSSIVGGFAGSMIVQGIKRGLFSNEAGMGSAPNAAASASVSHPAKQGLVQTLSVFIDTIVICTCSAVMIMIFVQDPAHMALTPFGSNGEGTLTNMPLVQQTMLSAFGDLGIIFMTVAIFAFAFSSLIGNYFYAEQNFKFITPSRPALYAFRIVCAIVVFFGAQSTLTLAWNLADIFMGLEAIINIVVIIILGKWAFAALEDYKKQKAAGLDPVFVAEDFPGMPATECWHETREELETIDGGRFFGNIED
ncbi:MAG: alanine:cation symporter family protein [Eggerthellaceae bacterium]|nr:alanine:cation symporter family protein [Eggerthellaceae bacterium]